MNARKEVIRLEKQLIAIQELIQEYGSHRSMWNVEQNIKQRMKFYEKK